MLAGRMPVEASMMPAMIQAATRTAREDRLNSKVLSLISRPATVIKTPLFSRLPPDMN